MSGVGVCFGIIFLIAIYTVFTNLYSDRYVLSKPSFIGASQLRYARIPINMLKL